MRQEVITRRITPSCKHNKFIIDKTLSTIECGICHKDLNPIWVIEQYWPEESRARIRVDELNKISEKAAKKNRCKCEKCGLMTRIEK